MMEAEEGFLSNDDPEGDRSTLPEIFSKILKDLNTSGICTITGKNKINLGYFQIYTNIFLRVIST